MTSSSEQSGQNPLAGWYPDPADAARQRYWAGDAWTTETRLTATGPASAAPVAASDPYAAYASSQGVTPAGVPPVAPAYPSVPAYPLGPPPAYPGVAYPSAVGPRTADGVPLAGWWWRVLASIIDSLAVSIVAFAFIPLYAPRLFSGYMQWFNDLMNSALSNPNSINPDIPSFMDPKYGIASSIIAIQVVVLVVTILYVFLMLHFLGATLGQLACGLRVVPVDKGLAPRGLPVYSIVMRIVLYGMITPLASIISMMWLTSNPTSITNSMASLGGMSWLSDMASLFALLNVLWALWDPKRQCLHDKVARTQVIRTR